MSTQLAVNGVQSLPHVFPQLENHVPPRVKFKFCIKHVSETWKCQALVRGPSLQAVVGGFEDRRGG